MQTIKSQNNGSTRYLKDSEDLYGSMRVEGSGEWGVGSGEWGVGSGETVVVAELLSTFAG